jgi:hypothetical protein
MLRFLLDLFWNRPWPASSIRLSRRLRRPNPRSREINPHAGSVQLQIARLCEAMIVARTMMMEGDLRAMDRLTRVDARTRPLSWLRDAAGFAPRGRLAPAAPNRTTTRTIGAVGSRDENFHGYKALKRHEMEKESVDWSPSPFFRGGGRGGVLRGADGSLRGQKWATGGAQRGERRLCLSSLRP